MTIGKESKDAKNKRPRLKGDLPPTQVKCFHSLFKLSHLMCFQLAGAALELSPTEVSLIRGVRVLLNV